MTPDEAKRELDAIEQAKRRGLVPRSSNGAVALRPPEGVSHLHHVVHLPDGGSPYQDDCGEPTPEEAERIRASSSWQGRPRWESEQSWESDRQEGESYFEFFERRGRKYEKARDYRREESRRPEQPQSPQTVQLIPQAQFLEGFTPPDYLVDGVLQRRFFYSLTAVTGGGKTAIALALARAVGCVDPTATFGKHKVERGKVVYFVGENPEDVRVRLIGANSQRNDDPSTDRIWYIPGVFNIEQLRAQIVAQIEAIGGVDLVIIDTSAAYFLKDDENNNPQIGAHARLLRSLTTLPGGPCVLALCHPVKHASAREHLLPRGGGAFLAEVDGNLTAWRHGDDLVELHHGDKFRGPGFEPISFRIEKITTEKLVDSKGRLLPTIRAVPISEDEEEREAGTIRQEQDKLLLELLSNSDRSVADIARACKFVLDNGEPHKSKTFRRLGDLKDDRLIKNKRGRWILTDEGKTAAEKLQQAAEDDLAEERGGKAGSKAKFHAVDKGKLGKTVPCAHCHKADGRVYKIGDGRVAKRHYEALHKACAKPFFEGEPSPERTAEPVPDEEQNALL